MVSSGATGMGKRLLRTKSRMSMSIAEVTEQVTNSSLSDLASLNEEEEHHQHQVGVAMMNNGGGLNMNDGLGGSMLNGGVGVENSKKTFQSACAAGGQFEMMRCVNKYCSYPACFLLYCRALVGWSTYAILIFTAVLFLSSHHRV